MGRLAVMRRHVLWLAAAAWVLAVAFQAPYAAPQPSRTVAGHAEGLFQTSDNCMACHNGLVTTEGEDVSIGVSWRASMMANSSRDPYWQASVRRETLDHPGSANRIEDECATCHMPMSRHASKASGRHGSVFSLLPSSPGDSDAHRLAADGVSCSLCHQIGADRLGTRDSFAGNFIIQPPENGTRRMFGPFDVDRGRQAIMRSSTGVRPAEAEHVQRSELCATCHTLYTEALGPKGEVIGSLPEQVPYLEWRHSSFADQQSCQSCHMPRVKATPIASVLGEERDHLARHTFLGGNFFMLRMLNRYRDILGVTASTHELDSAALATMRQLQADTASVAVTRTDLAEGQLAATVVVRNRTGHKLPTGYPSRRVWLHVTVRDRDGQTLFESGSITPRGSIEGNDGDADPARVEPHHDEIRTGDQVQIYESVMADPAGAVTTGLLEATQFVKDNRLLPTGFDKMTAGSDIAVRGTAQQDSDFGAGGDIVRYVVAIGAARGPFRVDVELRYQPIAFRWADNLRQYRWSGAKALRVVLRFDGGVVIHGAGERECGHAVGRMGPFALYPLHFALLTR